MLTFEEAKKIGREACIEKLGRDFYDKYKSGSTFAYGDWQDEGVTYCYVGVDDRPMTMQYTGTLMLTNKAAKDSIPYFASCTVALADGEIEFLECALPNRG